jgi:hypothetical protein
MGSLESGLDLKCLLLIATVDSEFAEPHADTSVKTAIFTRQNTSISADPH